MLKDCLRKILQFLLLTVAILVLRADSLAQFVPASPPIADPADARFEGVVEDWSTPSLSTSHLKPVGALVAAPDEESAYTAYLIRLQWRWGDPIDLYLTMPKGVSKPPVILYLYGYPAESDIFRDDKYREAVTKNGFAAACFVSALTGYRYHDRPMKEWFVSELQESLATSAHDVQMVLDYLAARGDLDMNRVGMFTQGSGSSIAILASAVDPRIKVLDTLDPWGDWPTWMAKSPFVPEEERLDYVKPGFLKKASTLEPVQCLPKVRAKKFRLQQTAYDENTPDSAKEKLRAAVPAGASVVVYKNSQDYGNAMVGLKQLEWVQGALKALDVPAPASSPVAKTIGSATK